MTREEVILKHRHELGGLVMDALVGGQGAELSLRIRQIMVKVDQLIGRVYDEAQPEKPKPLPTNGVAATTRK